MNTLIICNKNIFTKKEKAKEILFGTSKPSDFEVAFEFMGEVYYKKVV